MIAQAKILLCKINSAWITFFFLLQNIWRKISKPNWEGYKDASNCSTAWKIQTEAVRAEKTRNLLRAPKGHSLHLSRSVWHFPGSGEPPPNRHRYYNFKDFQFHVRLSLVVVVFRLVWSANVCSGNSSLKLEKNTTTCWRESSQNNTMPSLSSRTIKYTRTTARPHLAVSIRQDGTRWRCEKGGSVCVFFFVCSKVKRSLWNPKPVRRPRLWFRKEYRKIVAREAKRKRWKVFL